MNRYLQLPRIHIDIKFVQTKNCFAMKSSRFNRHSRLNQILGIQRTGTVRVMDWSIRQWEVQFGVFWDKIITSYHKAQILCQGYKKELKYRELNIFKNCAG